MNEIERLTEEAAKLREERDALAATCEQYYDYCKALGITPVPAIGKPSYNLTARDEKSRREGAVAAVRYWKTTQWCGCESCLDEVVWRIERGELRPWEGK